MSTEHLAATFFGHWFWVAFFIVFGVYLMARPRAVTSACCGSLRSRSMKGLDAQTRERLDAAAVRREESERIPRYVGLYLGFVSISLGIVASFVRVQPALLYGILCLELGTTTALTYLHLRNSAPRRFAVLSVRTIESVIPAYWFVLSIVAGFSLLSYLSSSDFTVSAIVVCASTLLTTAIAWRLTRLPARLSGIDLPAEQLVDDRLRFGRSASALILALVQPFVFCSQALDQASSLQTAAFAFSLALWVGFSVWVLVRQTRPLTIASA